MFGVNYRKTLKLEKLFESDVSFNEVAKSFKIVLKNDGFSHEHSKKIDKMGLKIVAISKTETGEILLFLKNRSPLAQIVIGILSFEVLLFSLTIFVLLLKTNFR